VNVKLQLIGLKHPAATPIAIRTTAELAVSNSEGNKDMPVSLPQSQQMPDIVFTKGALTFRK
jgi:hypothetical protein